MIRQVSPMLLAVPVVLALALAALWLGLGPAAAWRQWQAPEPQAPNLDDVKAATLGFNPAAGAAYPQVLERPQLNPARRPQAAASAVPEAAPPTAIEEAKMQGIVAGATLTGVFLEEKGEARFVRLGEKVGDWTLQSIQGRDILFKRGSEERRIELPYARADTAPQAGQPPAPPAANRRGAPPPATRNAPGTAAAPAPTPPPAVAPAPSPAPVPDASAPRRGGFGGGGQRPPARNTP